jgi:hypothetical protein
MWEHSLTMRHEIPGRELTESSKNLEARSYRESSTGDGMKKTKATKVVRTRQHHELIPIRVQPLVLSLPGTREKRRKRHTILPSTDIPSLFS